MVRNNKTTSSNQEQGFALLMTLIVVTVVIAIGLTVLDLSTKQIRLSTNAKDSEIAFHAANAGMECARYWRRESSDDMENGESIDPSCFEDSTRTLSNTNNPQIIMDSDDGDVFKYVYSFTWAGETRCSEITALVASSTSSGDGLTINNMSDLIPGYPGGATDEKECAAGERCTVLSVRGYNKPCNNVTGYGTVQREVLLQF